MPLTGEVRLDERRVTSIMTPRQQFYAIDLDDDAEAIRAQVASSPHTRIVVCKGGTDNVLGIVVNGARCGELYSKYTYYYSKVE